MRRYALLFLFLLLPLWGEASPRPTTSETVTVNLVEVPVTVADSRGDPVRGLTAANFEILDDGVKRPVTSFDVVDFTSKESVAATSPLNPAARRNFLLLFDLSNSAPNALRRAQEAARRFVAESVQPRDLVAVGTIDADRSFRMLSSFTTDRGLIKAAMADPRDFRGTDPLGLANHTTMFTPSIESEGDTDGSRSVPLAEGKAGFGDEHMKDMADLAKHSNEGAVRERIDRQIDALGEIATMLRNVPGRKQLIYLSEGFDGSYLTGRDVRATKDLAEENAAILHGDYSRVDNDNRFGSANSVSLLSRMVDYFRRSDVILNAVDIQGLRVQNDLRTGLTINSNAGLAVLARPTGGDVFQNSNDLGNNFDRFLHRQEVVYIVGFAGAASHPGSFHRLSVRLIGVPRGSRASFRTGYFEGGGDSGEAAVLSDAAIIAADVPQQGVRLAELATAIPSGGARATVPVIIDLDRADVVGESERATVELFTYAFDAGGVVRDSFHETLQVSGASTARAIRYYSTLSLGQGEYAIKTLARVAQTGRKGFARTDVQVPAPRATLVLPPLFLEEAGQSMLVRGVTHDAAPFPFHINGTAFMPAASVDLVNGVPRRYVLYVLNALADDLTVDTTLVDSSGTRHPAAPVIVGRVQGAGVSKLVYDLTVTGMKPGAGRLDVAVRTTGSSASTASSVPVMIEQ